jgi:hypothetical protein
MLKHPAAFRGPVAQEPARGFIRARGVERA